MVVTTSLDRVAAAISAAVLAIRVAEIPVAVSCVGESEMTLLDIIPVYEDLDGADYNQTDESVSLSSEKSLTPRTQFARTSCKMRTPP